MLCDKRASTYPNIQSLSAIRVFVKQYQQGLTQQVAYASTTETLLLNGWLG